MCVCSWSRDGHKLVSASTDNIVSQWDVLTGDCDQRFRFPSPILKLQYHPRDMWVRRRLPAEAAVVLVLKTFLFVFEGTKCWCVPWNQPRSCWLCPTPNMLCCLWMMIRTWMWWQLSTGGGSTSTLATPREKLVHFVSCYFSWGLLSMISVWFISFI